MFTHPAITEALASQHRRDLITQAEGYRLARAARSTRTARPGLFGLARLAQPAKRAVTAAAAVFAAAVLIAAPAGPAHWAGPQASTAHLVTQHVSAKRWW